MPLLNRKLAAKALYIFTHIYVYVCVFYFDRAFYDG